MRLPFTATLRSCFFYISFYIFSFIVLSIPVVQGQEKINSDPLLYAEELLKDLQNLELFHLFLNSVTELRHTNVQKADSLLLEMNEVYEKTDNYEQRIYLLMDLSEANRGDVEYAEESLAIALESQNQDLLFRSHVAVINAYHVANNPKAIEVGTDALKYATLTSDSSLIYLTISNLFFDRGSNEEGLYYLKKAERGIKEGTKLSTVYHSRLGFYFLNTVSQDSLYANPLDSAYYHYKKSAEDGLKINDKELYLLAKENMAIVKETKGLYDEAEVIYLEVLEEAKANNYEAMQMYVFDDLSYLYGATKEYHKAIKYANKQYELAIEMNSDYYKQGASRKLYNLNETIGNYKEAYLNHRLYKEHSDSLYNIANIKRLTEVRVASEFEQEKQILKATTLRNRIAAISAFLIALITLIFLYKNQRQKKLITEQNQELNVLNDTKDQIFSIIGHDLKKPVLAFRGLHEKFSYLINNNQQEQLLKFSASIDKEAIQLNKLTDNLLSWALLQHDVLNVTKEKINLSKVTQEVIDLFISFADNKSITLTHAVPDIIIMSDRHALSTILRNLVDNAIKYTHEGGTVDLYANQEGGRVILEVKDSGTGIDKEKIGKIFLLSKGKTTDGTYNEKGTGLGLHIVKELVNKCRGTIAVKSKINEGTTFTLSLPI